MESATRWKFAKIGPRYGLHHAFKSLNCSLRYKETTSDCNSADFEILDASRLSWFRQRPKGGMALGFGSLWSFCSWTSCFQLRSLQLLWLWCTGEQQRSMSRPCPPSQPTSHSLILLLLHYLLLWVIIMIITVRATPSQLRWNSSFVKFERFSFVTGDQLQTTQHNALCHFHHWD